MNYVFFITVIFCLFIVSIEEEKENVVNTCGKDKTIRPSNKEDCVDKEKICCFLSVESKGKKFCASISYKYDDSIKKEFAEAIGTIESDIVIDCNHSKLLKMGATILTIIFALLF